jgi:hypothetical protein
MCRGTSGLCSTWGKLRMGRLALLYGTATTKIPPQVRLVSIRSRLGGGSDSLAEKRCPDEPFFWQMKARLGTGSVLD